MKNQIIDLANIKQAYLDLANQFEEKLKTTRYTGFDSVKLTDVDYKATGILDEVRSDLVNSAPLTPVRLVNILKKDGKKREVFILTVKDRIRARAIYRILEPLFELNYSPYLFSYRSSHPSAYAARSVARRYHRYFGQDYVMTIDIKDYFNYLDHDVIRKQLTALGIKNDVLEMIEPFFKIKLWQNGKLVTWDKGIPQGTPFNSLFSNYYLTDLDNELGSKVSLYRRVGDDLIAFDKNKEKLEEVFNLAKKRITDLGLVIQDKKTHFAKNTEEFSYLGYLFKDNSLRLRSGLVRELKIAWHKELKYNHSSLEKKVSKLKSLCFFSENNFQTQFLEILKQHQQLDDDEGVKQLSNQFYNYVAAYLFGKATPRNRRLAKEKLKEIKIPSFYEYYLAYRRGKKKSAA
ncbi:MAG: reverse transcriptase domain-containing protein [Patescibacteria group bacterium]